MTTLQDTSFSFPGLSPEIQHMIWLQGYRQERRVVTFRSLIAYEYNDTKEIFHPPRHVTFSKILPSGPGGYVLVSLARY
jgi:hypothetical protein